MLVSFRTRALSGLLSAATLGIPTAHAATFTNGPAVSSICLDVRAGNPNNFTPVLAFPCNGTLAQVWNFAGLAINGIGTTGLGGKCLDVSGAGTADSTPVQLFQCNGTGAQTWVYSNGRLINTHSGKCLDVGNGAPGTQARIRTCNGSNGQNWVIR